MGDHHCLGRARSAGGVDQRRAVARLDAVGAGIHLVVRHGILA